MRKAMSGNADAVFQVEAGDGEGLAESIVLHGAGASILASGGTPRRPWIPGVMGASELNAQTEMR